MQLLKWTLFVSFYVHTNLIHHKFLKPVLNPPRMYLAVQDVYLTENYSEGKVCVIIL
jgi:hypothetical protein